MVAPSRASRRTFSSLNFWVKCHCLCEAAICMINSWYRYSLNWCICGKQDVDKAPVKVMTDNTFSRPESSSFFYVSDIMNGAGKVYVCECFSSTLMSKVTCPSYVLANS